MFAFTRAGRRRRRRASRGRSAPAWAGGIDERPPEELDGALIFAPAGELVPAALRGRRARAASVVCGGIHMSDIPSFAYELLWGERVLRSVANLTRADGSEFLRSRRAIPVRTT